MKLSEYVGLDGLGMARLVKEGEVSAAELMECALALVEDQKDDLNAVAFVDEESARAKARGAAPGIFQGVPFLVKELLAWPGLRSPMGSRLFAGYVAGEHSPYTRSLEEAGLVVFGNTTSSEFGLLGSTETALHGVSRNPWHSAYSAAGSSGGSAAAVAGGIVPFAHANDAGGSIRVPASVCGVFGFKPSAGRSVPAADAGMLGGLVTHHCISKSVRDSAALLAVTEARGAEARFESVGFVSEPGRRRLKIGYYIENLMGQEPDPEVEAALRDVVGLCSGLGHEVILSPGPRTDGKALSDAFFTLAGSTMAQMASTMESALGRKIGGDDLEPFTLALIDWYFAQGSDAFERAMSTVHRAAEQMNVFCGEFDALLCPTLSATPKPIGFLSPRLDREELVARTESWVGYTPIHNIAGMPAMSVPLSASQQGLPIGSHFAARPGADAVLLGLAYELEEAAPWVGRLPVRRVEGA